MKAFSETTKREDKEFGEGDVVPPAEWPLTGKVVMEDVSASYNRADPQPLLSNLLLVIHSREKVALCGRTGSGKSSVLALLLRLLDPLTSQSAFTPRS